MEGSPDEDVEVKGVASIKTKSAYAMAILTIDER